MLIDDLLEQVRVLTKERDRLWWVAAPALELIDALIKSFGLKDGGAVDIANAMRAALAAQEK